MKGNGEDSSSGETRAAGGLSGLWAGAHAVLRARVAHALQAVLLPEFEHSRYAVGHLEARLIQSTSFSNLHQAELQVFSQFGEDGIIQYLVSKVPIGSRRFVELGVGDYRESNTRFLLQKDAWEGLAVDARRLHLAFIESTPIRWRHRLYGRSAFLDADNVNQVIADAGFDGDVGLLSIDIDGNDYWVLKALDVVSPRIIVAEYNAVFGPTAAATIPYDPCFGQHVGHPSGVYFGASLAALCHLLSAKGYQLVGCGSAGVNAFFVRQELAGELPCLEASDGWVPSQHRLPMDPATYLNRADLDRQRLRLVADLPVYDVLTDKVVSVADLLDLG